MQHERSVILSLEKIILLVLIVMIAALALSQPGSRVEAALGENAYEFQRRTGFDMGYPSGPGSPIGGQERVSQAVLYLGPVTVACDNAWLQLLRSADMLTGGRLFCPAEDGVAEVAVLREQISQVGSWDTHKNHTLNPRRASEFGTDPADAFAYLAGRTMTGTVLRVPLYSWKNNTGLFMELNAVRHAKLDGVASWELTFHWHPDCIFDLSMNAGDVDEPSADDAVRAALMQEKAARICDPLPGPRKRL